MTPGNPKNPNAVTKRKIHTEDNVNGEKSAAKKVKDDENDEEISSGRSLRRAKEMRKRDKKKAPKLKMESQGNAALLTVNAKERKSIICDDVRKLMTKCLLGNTHLDGPLGWCHVEKVQKCPQAVVLIVDGLTLNNFSSQRNGFPECRKLFLTRLDTLMPLFRRRHVLEKLTNIPLSEEEREKLVKKHGDMQKALEEEKVLVEGEKCEIARENDVPDTFSRLKLLLSPLQMVAANYPLPMKETTMTRNYVYTNDQYASVTPRSPMFAMDCEMVKTSFGFNEVVRISIVNEDCESIYETFVRPQRPVIDYRTDFSGMTAEIIETATKTLKDVQEDIRSLLPADAIIVGHSLNADLKALRMIHPYVIDTSMIYNVRGDKKRSKLRELAKMFLEENIQWHPLGHDSIEDSQTCMKLVKKKLSQGIHFGDLLMQKLKDTDFDIDTLGGLTGSTEEENISGNLFGYLLNKNEDAKISIVAAKCSATDYNRFIPKCWRGSERISVDVKNSNKAAMKKTIKSIPEATLSITHLEIEEEELKEDKLDATLDNVDKWIEQIWNATKAYGLCVVIFAGSRESRSGLTFVEFRKVDFVDIHQIQSS